MRADAVRIVGSEDEVTAEQNPFTPSAKKVFELAIREALGLGHVYVGTEHVLLGLAREEQGIATRILSDYGADSDTISNEVLRRVRSAV